MNNLYTISEKYELLLCGYLTQSEEDAVEYGDITLDNLLGSIESEFNEKVVNVCLFIKNIDVEIESISHVINDLQKRKNKLISKRDNLADLVKNSMVKVGVEKIHSTLFDVKIAKNPSKLIIDDPNLIPECYILTSLVDEINKKKIKEDLKNMIGVAGAELQYSTRLVIK
jgi:hypothetical protein